MTIARGRPVLTDARWREFDFGSWEGLRVDEVDPGVNARLYAPPGGETFAQVCERVRAALDDLRRAAAGTALVVTHAGPLHALLEVLFGGMPFRFEPATITQIRFDGDAAQLVNLGITVRQYADERQAGPGPQERTLS